MTSSSAITKHTNNGAAPATVASWPRQTRTWKPALKPASDQALDG